MRYIKQLDAMRAIAILFVFCNHATPEGSLLYNASEVISAPDVFFTVSGFLITAILFKDKIAYEEHRFTKSEIFKGFFVKRALRIFPAYYLTLLLAYIINKNEVSSFIPYLTFTANYNIYAHQAWEPLGHLWSMSVEQQFYLIWPLVIVFTPRKLLPFTIGLFIICGLINQQFLPNTDFAGVLPQTCFDALGIGALLAWFVTYQPALFNRAHYAFTALAVGSAAIITVQTAADIPVLPFIHQRTHIALITVWLISYFLYNKEKEGGRLGFIFNNPFLISLGKISYGFYLFHITFLYYSYDILHSLNQFLPFYRLIAGSRYFYIAENFILITGLAWLSWKYFELPIYALQKRFLPAGKMKSRVQETLVPQRKAPLTEATQLTVID